MTLSERFHQKWIPEPYSGCWLWSGGVDGKGYGALWQDNKLQRAHRISWILHNGEIPNRLFVLHKCDTPSCVNPNHLFLGNQSDNTLDSIRKGRYSPLDNKGEKNPISKANERIIFDIRSSDKSCSELAIRYNLEYSTVWKIKRYMSWKHLP